MVNLDRIATFIQVVEENSFSAAAKKQNVSVPAISKQILSLEKELGTQLIRRTTRRLTLTSSGQIYLEHCKRLMKEVYELTGLSSQLQAQPQGVLKALVSRHFGEKYVVPHLKEFLKLYPQITLDLELNERTPDPARENFDLIFGVSVSGPDQWIQKKISKSRYVFCATPEYLKKHGIPERPIDLAHHHYITHKMRKPDDILEFKKGIEIYIKPFLKLNDTRAMLETALQGLGIVKLHDYVVEDSLKKGQLIEVLREFSHEEIPIYALYQPSQFLQPKIREFIRFFSEKMR